MAKNKNRNIYNIDHVNMEIDYDKLAKAIVKAQKEAAAPKEEQKPPKLTLFQALKSIWLILRNKADTHSSLSVGAFGMPIYIMLKFTALVGFIIFAAGTIHFAGYLFNMDWHSYTSIVSNLYVIFILVTVLIFVFLYAVMLWGAANELEKEEDKNYIVAVFSGLVSFVALIVSLVALYKGGCGC